ncbi:MAG: delta-60 repeat domain-containing protein [Myxococcaceae bacterium]
MSRLVFHRRLLAVVATLACEVAFAQPPTFVGQPTVASNAGHQVLVTWTTSITATSQIAWGPSSTGSFAAYPNSDTPTQLVGTVHSRVLRRLGPGTWFLRVRSTNGTDVLDSGELSVTVPAVEFPLAEAALDGTVNAVVSRNGTFYVGGSFTRKFDLTGSAFVATRATGSHAAHFPEVAGQVNAAVVDAAGGLIVCGNFRYVGGVSRRSLARLLPDGNLDHTFTLGTDTSISDCAIAGTTLYVVGPFTTFGGQLRGHGAAVELSTNTLLPWNPALGGNALTVATDGTTVWVGGEFTTPHAHVAAFDATTALPLAFQADTDLSVAELELNGSTLYLGGRFTTVRGTARPLLAAVDATTGTLVPSFDAQLVGTEVDSLALQPGGALYVGGVFTSASGMARNSLAAVDSTSGVLQAFNPALSATATVLELRVDGSELLVGGLFSSLGGATRRNAGAVAVATGLATPFNPDLSGAARTFAVLPSTDVLVGGAFAGGNNSSAVSRFVSVDALTGAYTLGPSFGGTVFAMAAGTNELYATGFFTTVGGQARSNVAALSLPALAVTPWAPVVDQSTHGVGVGPDGTIYLGGDFTHVNSVVRNYAAAVDPDGGLVASWDPGPNNSVESMHLGNDAVFLGGTFNTVGGVAHQRIVAVGFDGTVSGWNAGANNTVYAITSTASAVYVGGLMTNCLGTGRGLGCAFAPTGGLRPWNPRADAQVSALLPYPTRLWVGGAFTAQAPLLVRVDDGTGTLTGNPEFAAVGAVRSIASDCTSNRVLVGGNFLQLGASAVGGLAIIDGTESCMGGPVGRVTLDAGVDAGVVDAGVDAGEVDAGELDAGVDAGLDAGELDAGELDAGELDAGDLDAGELDAGGVDAGTDDAGAMSDAGVEHGPYGVGCGCTEVPAFSVVLLAALSLARRRRVTSSGR